MSLAKVVARACFMRQRTLQLNNLCTSCVCPQQRNSLLIHNYKCAQTLKNLRNYSSRPVRPTRKTNEGDNLKSFDWKTIVIVSSLGTIGILAMKHYKNKKLKQLDTDMIRSYGTPQLGGDFELLDQNGKPCTNKDFLGKWILIYFGFTNCPDVCPEELEKMINAVDIVNRKKSLPNVHPVFISIDPDRDTPESIKEYLKDFSEDFVGLTGTPEQVDEATRAFRVYYSVGPKDEDDDYLVDHSIIMYLINDQGEYCEYFGQTRSAGEIATQIMTKMDKNFMFKGLK